MKPSHPLAFLPPIPFDKRYTIPQPAQAIAQTPKTKEGE